MMDTNTKKGERAVENTKSFSDLNEFERRGLVAQESHPQELREELAKGPITLYAGFDPTAPSLHVGHLLPLVVLIRCARQGHRSLALLGNGTAAIGDPTGKTDMRKMLSLEDVEQNCESISSMMQSLASRHADGGKIDFVKNGDWLKDQNYLSFLREIGPHFSVNRMLSAECFKSRMESGLSFLEFNYMIFQAFDFLQLHEKQGCVLQVGGDDQWSNMLAGVDLIRRKRQKPAYCLTHPLLTTKSGQKMGKTEKGAVWLDPNLTSPYEFFQFWRNVEDDMVVDCFRYFTFVDTDEIDPMEKTEGQGWNALKQKLAFEITSLVHGEGEAAKAQDGAKSFFSGAGQFGDAPEVALSADFFAAETVSILDLLVASGLVKTKSEGRRMVESGGITAFIGGEATKITDVKKCLSPQDFVVENGHKQLVLRKGKKSYAKLVVSQS